MIQRQGRKFTALILLSVIFLGGCAGIRHGAANITSVPAGAEVINMDDDTLLGVTPVIVWWSEDGTRRKFVNIRLHKKGFRDKTSFFWLSLRHADKNSALKDPQLVKVNMSAK